MATQGSDGTLVYYPDDPLWTDRDDHPVPKPAEREVSTGLQAIELLVDPPDGEGAGRAANVNTLGEVPDSSWFTNRHGRERMGLDELRRGPDRVGPPAEGPWRVVGEPGSGRTPKLLIEDRAGHRYLLKLDATGFPEQMSSAEVIATKFFHASGYNVPENHVVAFRPSRLVLLDDAEAPSHRLKEFVENTHRTPDGRIRGVASLMIRGEPIGAFSHEGRRPDDPNDVFPHEDRRELRGLRVLAAWLNHTDSKEENSLDVWIPRTEGDPEERLGHVRHYLIDFGSALGAGARRAKSRLTGHETYFETRPIFKSLLTLGAWVRPYVVAEYPDHPAVGNVAADPYDPGAWRPPIPNPAFARMDAADAFWAARIAARFTDEEIRAIVSTGEINDPSAEDHLVGVLVQRRDRTVAHWLGGTNPLDDFRIERKDGISRLRFDNAAERHGLVTRGSIYRYRWRRLDNRTGRGRVPGEEGLVPGAEILVPAEGFGPPDSHGLRHAEVEIATIHPARPGWARPVTVGLRRGPAGVEVVGIRRPRGVRVRSTDDGNPLP